MPTKIHRARSMLELELANHAAPPSARIARRGLRLALRLQIAVCAALLVDAGSSQAAPRYKKREVKVEAAERKQTRAGAPLVGGESGSKGPALGADAFRQAISQKMAQLTDQAIATLKRLIRVTGEKDPEKPDFFFRLAEHYREKKREYMYRARELDEVIYRASTEAEKNKLKAQQKRYEQLEKEWMLGAIKLYLNIANTQAYARYQRMDEVLFNLADMLNQANRRDRARAFFGELIRNYPQSKYIPDAYLSFAEHYFNDNEIEEALRRYEQVARYKSSPLYGYALYKQAWCWINLKDPRRALELFQQVIREGNQFAGTAKSKIILVKEAKKDLVRAYAMVGTPERAWPYFRRIGGDFAPRMLERLATIYYDQGKFVPSIQVFRQLMALEPKSASLCDWQYNVVRAALSGLTKREQVVETRRLAAVYDSFRRRGGLKQSVLQQCKEHASGTLRELATTWHNEAQKTQNNETYALAHYLYKEYLESFPKEKDAYPMSFYYAELLFKLERWAEAADAYTAVVKLDPKGKHLKEAAYAAVVSWKNALNVAEEIKDTESAGAEVELKPRPIPENQQKMIAAFDTYLSYVPDSEERPAIMYRKARIYYENNHFERAAREFAAVVEKYPSHELAVYSANLLLDSLNALKRYDELAVWVERLVKIPQLAESELKDRIFQLRAEVQRKKLEQDQQQGRYRECGEGYARLASDYPDDKKWAELAYNSALCFEAAKLIGQAIQIRHQLIKVMPKHPLAQKAMHMIGANYHALAWYSRAAEWYERFARDFPGEAEAPEALQNAIVFRLGRAEYDKAREDIEFFAKTYGKRPKYAAQSAKVVFSLGEMYEQRGDYDGMVKHYNQYLRDWGRYGGVDRQIVAHVKIGQALWQASCPISGLHGACIKIERVRSKRTVARKGTKKRDQTAMRKQCGPDTKNKVTVVERNRSKVRQAQKHFREALALSRRAKQPIKAGTDEETARRGQEMRFALAAALFNEAEGQLEQFLAVEFPQDLDFSGGNERRRKESLNRFRKYLETKGKMLERARETYQEVIKQQVPHWAIAAAARIGQLFQDFADALYTAPIPKPVIPGGLQGEAREDFIATFRDTYCDTLETKAQPLEDKAVQALAACLTRSTNLSWYNEWSALCEQELNQIRPAEWPLAAELRAQPGYVSVQPDVAGVITAIK